MTEFEVKSRNDSKASEPSLMSRIQHLITKIQQICQEIRDIKGNRTYQKPQQTFIKPQTSPNPPLCHHNHSNKTLCSNAPSSPKEGEPVLKMESSPQIITNSPDPMPKVSPQAPQNHPGHPMPENPNLEKGVHNIETTSPIDLKTMNPISEHPNHPTIIFSEFMDKEWGEVQTEGWKGVDSEGDDQEVPCHMVQPIGGRVTQPIGASMTQPIGASMTQQTEAGMTQEGESGMTQESETGMTQESESGMTQKQGTPGVYKEGVAQ